MFSAFSRPGFLPGSRSRCLATIALLTVALVGLVVLINRHYFFHAEIYPTGDQAANSLEVLRCKQFQVYLGNYSRWGFHHPGPFYFYYLAAAETIFWQWLHLTPTPFGAQVLGTLLLTAGFFAVGVGIAARWVRSALFVPLALLLAALHYTAVHLQMCLLDTWTAYVAPMPYFCLVIAAASVAAGQGEDLPALVFAGCVLIHLHVSNPLFVLPLFALAYAGLAWAGRSGLAPEPATPPARAPWRRYPRAHVLAAGLAFLFVLPILVDLCHGADNNFHHILKHLRTHQGEHYPYLDAVYYFLCFGAYKPGIFGNVKIPGGITPGELRHFVLSHGILLVWPAALLSPLLALAVRAGLKPLSEGGTGEATEPLDGARWRFLGWLVAGVALCVPLAVFWAHIQDGEMLYYNAWYIYSIYGVVTLIAAVALSDLLERTARRFRRPGWLVAGLGLFCLAAAEADLGWPHLPERNFARLGDYDWIRTERQTVLDALAAHPDAPRTKFLVIPDNVALAAAAGVAIVVKRAGYDFRVLPISWNVMFPTQNALPDTWLEAGAAGDTLPMEPWRIVRPRPKPGETARAPLIDDFALQVGYSKIDPASASEIVFGSPGRNSDSYALVGFSEPVANTAATWTVDHFGRLDFEAIPVPEDTDVEITLDFGPPLVDPATHPTQRLDIRYNTTALGTLTFGIDTPPAGTQVRVPAAVWNARAIGILTLGFPDAISPAALYRNPRGDPRLLGFSARKIVFRTVKAGPDPSRGR